MNEPSTSPRLDAVPCAAEDVAPLWDLLTLDCPPKELLQRSREVVMEGLMLRLDGLKTLTRSPGVYECLQIVRLDGYEVLAMQQGWGLFNPTRRRPASRWAVAQLRENETLHACRAALGSLLELASVDPAGVRLVLVPSDPSNRNLMARAFGLSLAADAPGLVLVQLWPSRGNLERLPAALARAAARQSLLADGTLALGQRPTAADLLRAEALADELAERAGLCAAGQLWRQTLAPPPDHLEALQHVAELSEVPSYDELDTNVYAFVDEGASTSVPPFEVTALDPEETEYTLQALDAELEETAPSRVAAALYGDPAARQWGHPGVGLSALAGVQVARLWSDARGAPKP
ncbi:MAG: hypothetical protein AAGA81_22110 [Acidobacteriota bacterium]